MRLVGVLILGTFLALSTGCAALQGVFQGTNAVKAGDTIEQRALAAYASITIGIEQIAALLEPGTLPDDLEAKLVVVADRAHDFAREGLEYYWQAENERAAFADGTRGTPDQLEYVLEQLDGWVTRAGPVLSDIQSAKKGEVR